MTRPLIKPHEYWDTETTLQEKENVFFSSWIYAAKLADLSKNNDFVTVNFLSHSIVVQNFDGDLKAFVNVCTHRFSRLHAACRGNRALICPYHSWSFNKDGMPQGIPQKPHFGDLDSATLESLRLDAWDLEICGQFIFVKHKKAHCGSLKDYLGSYYDVLLDISKGMAEEIDYFSIDLECNWKIAVENTLESYHVAPIHPKTFYRLGASGENFVIEKSHSSWNPQLNERTTQGWERAKNNYPDMQYNVSGYFHIYIYPNLTIATTNGASFSIQRFSPVTAGTTHFETWVSACKVGPLSSSNRVVIDMMNKSVGEFNRQVFMEDKAICREVQLGVLNADCPGLLSDIEDRVFAFQTAYRDGMDQGVSNSDNPL